MFTLALATSALGEGSLVVVDANQAILGELINVNPGPTDSGHFDLMLYRYGSNESMLVQVERDGLPTASIHYQTTDCTGQAWVLSVLDVWPGHAHATGIPGPDGQMYRVEPGLSELWFTPQSYLNQSGCHEGGAHTGHLPASPVGPAPEYAPPLSYVLNPSEF